MRRNVGAIPLCVGPDASGTASLGCVMTSIDGIRDAATHLDENVQKWILQYQADAQAAKAKRNMHIAAAAGGITLAALAAVAVAVKAGVVRLGDAAPMHPWLPWMDGFPVDAVARLRSGAPLDPAGLSGLTRHQRRVLARHAAVNISPDGSIDLSSWRLV
jgi:hypothetical protein